MHWLASNRRCVGGFPLPPTGWGKYIRVEHDNPNGIPRYTYARIEHGRVYPAGEALIMPVPQV